MNPVPRNSTAKNKELPKDILELTQMIATLPSQYRSGLEPLMDRVIESTRRRRRILSLVQEALSQLRLDMKYLVFDLEATRRERDGYRRQNEEGEAGE
ncbi:MAG: transcriptional regulator [Planctomycetota bacterium]